MAWSRRLGAAWQAGLARPLPELFPDPFAPKPDGLRAAAVLVAITARPAPGVLLICRPQTMRAHAGEVALPGGVLDAGEDAVAAALREAQEELGLARGDVTLIGTGDVLATGSGYAITPVLALVPPDVELTPNPDEVAQWFEAPLDHVFDKANHTIGSIERDSPEHGRILRQYVEIMWQGHRIWGATGAILATIAARLDWPELFGQDGTLA